MEELFINGKNNGYGTDQCGKTLTVGELIEILQEYDEDSLLSSGATSTGGWCGSGKQQKQYNHDKGCQ